MCFKKRVFLKYIFNQIQGLTEYTSFHSVFYVKIYWKNDVAKHTLQKALLISCTANL